jgi:two-component system phosphate regulon sensor histidine kinase PhoR
MRRVSRHDLTCIMLIWVPALLAAGLIASGVDSALVLSIAGIAAALATWAYIAFVARERSAWMTNLDQIVAGLWSALGEPAPQRREGDARDRAAWLVESLERASSPLATRAAQAAADRANLRSIYDAGRSPSFVTDAAGRVLIANAAAIAFFSRPALVGRSIEDLFTHAEVIGQHAAALGGQTRVSQVRLSRPEGLKIFQVIAAPLALQLVDPSAAPVSTQAPAQARGAVLTLRDVTELALAVQLKTDFVANASHELRTPLSSIRAAVETLADGAWDEPAMRERLARMISGNVARLEEMVRDLLDLSRLESPDAPVVIEPVSLRETVESLAESFAGVCAERRIEIAPDVAPDLDMIDTDRKLLTLILRNLIDNATKFAYEGTPVRVRAETIEPPAQSSVPRRHTVRIEVIDRGVGIPMGHQQRIFERFYQVDPSRAGFAARRGTGLGLAIVKHAVKALGGTISVESVWKEGTRMIVELPVQARAQLPADAPAP